MRLTEEGGVRDLWRVLRVVLVDVDMVQCGLLQAEDIDHGPVKDIVGLSKELVKAPTLLLVRLQDVGQDRGQEALKTPETTREQLRSCIGGHADSGGHKDSYCPTWTNYRTPASLSSTRSSRSHISDGRRLSQRASL